MPPVQLVSRTFEGYTFYVQHDGRAVRTAYLDCQDIRAHGGWYEKTLAPPRPLDFIVVEAPKKGKHYHHRLHPDFDYRHSNSWTLDDLVDKYECDRREDDPIIVQREFLAVCIQARRVLDHRDDYGGWRVRYHNRVEREDKDAPRPGTDHTEQHSNHAAHPSRGTHATHSPTSCRTSKGSSSIYRDRPARSVSSPIETEVYGRDWTALERSWSSGDSTPRPLTPPIKTNMHDSNGDLHHSNDSTLDASPYAISSNSSPTYTMRSIGSVSPAPRTTSQTVSANTGGTRTFSRGLSVDAATPTFPQEGKIFMDAFGISLTFHVESGPSTLPTTIKMFGGVLSSPEKAQFIVLRKSSQSPPSCEGLHALTRVVSDEWIWQCVQEGRLLDPTPFVIASPRGPPGALGLLTPAEFSRPHAVALCVQHVHTARDQRRE